MIDFGFDKLALIGAVALIVIGPEKLPRVARTVGHLMGKAQRYVADVKAEVNRSIELEELKKMKTQFEDAARDVEKNVHAEVQQASSEINSTWNSIASSPDAAPADAWHAGSTLAEPPLDYKPPKKNWRVKRGAVPQWYRHRHGVRAKALSGAARVARFRPPRAS
ncbi:MAG TPA: Sec-independent protein translocase protein TatB [Methylibium sp.]|uniref:Sec-independent protein translocase protein TatB n=1 Tax=Methylibium sp. TaxID=2067992 RepID=UPI002DC04EFD|nr:Sec-independent protein translocase protein TatB [Methylibium sp.]HEU4459309.1 Sec-independent protein translocase protein TatB [Methylibium sp.]